MTPDRLEQAENLYEFCLGNPFAYFDPDGEWAIALPLLTWTGGAITAPLWGPVALGAAASATIGYFGYKAYQNWECYRTKAGELQKEVEKGESS